MIAFMDNTLSVRVPSVLDRAYSADIPKETDMQEQEQAGKGPQGNQHPHVIHYTVSDEPQTTTERELTPTQIMTNAGINADENYLVEIRGRERFPYKDKPNAPIHMRENQQFVVVFVGPVPVS